MNTHSTIKTILVTTHTFLYINAYNLPLIYCCIYIFFKQDNILKIFLDEFELKRKRKRKRKKNSMIY